MNWRLPFHWILWSSFTLLTGCAGLMGNVDKDNPVDCKALQSSCHSGRFGLVYKTLNDQGEEEGDSVSGTYSWRSGRGGASNQREVAFLEVNSTLGASLGTARRLGDFYEVRAADGRVYLAKDWQTLFDLMFPMTLPAESLIKWMRNPQPSSLPELPPNWEWQVNKGKYRLLFKEGRTSGRIDLLPQTLD